MPGMSASQVISVFNSISSCFFERLDRNIILKTILDAAVELGGAERGTIFVLPGEASPSSGEIELKSLVAIGLDGREIRVKVPQGIVGQSFARQESIISNDVLKDSRFFADIDEVTSFKTRSILCAPLKTIAGQRLGVIELLNSRRGGFTDGDLEILEVLALFASVALDRSENLAALAKLNEALRAGQNHPAADVMAQMARSRNPDLRAIHSKVSLLAESDVAILIMGESGTGKEGLAQLIHRLSRRASGPYVVVNCAAIPESLFEAELFGVAKGAATGTEARLGKIELADGGTLLLDEIGELPLELQAKLLRVLQDKLCAPVGSQAEPKRINFRLLASTNRDLEAAVAAGKFREDLLFRINVAALRLPALRQRSLDIPDLAVEILQQLCREHNQAAKRLSDEARAFVSAESWPGNIRQLRNFIEHALIVSGARPTIERADFPATTGAPSSAAEEAPAPSHAVAAEPRPDRGAAGVLELRTAKARASREAIMAALAKTGGNKTEAARILGMSREGLRKALRKMAA